jgi:succinate-semialdehyde dehydrogenase / glutarate-semialdehyde dehydrogenase
MPISSINPATREVLQTFAHLTNHHLEQKLARAAEAFREYRRTSFAERTSMMKRAAEILENEKYKFARLMTLEMGKPIKAAVQEAEKCAWVCSSTLQMCRNALSRLRTSSVARDFPMGRFRLC